MTEKPAAARLAAFNFAVTFEGTFRCFIDETPTCGVQDSVVITLDRSQF